jgi:hypothetical protein
MWLTLGYASLRDSLYRIELVLPILIGAIPAAIIYFRFIAPRDAA